MAKARFRQATEQERALFDSVIHDYYSWLTSWEIGLLFRNEPRVMGGRACFATAHKASGPMPFLTGWDGWVEVCERFWDARSEEWHRYLYDHELFHFTEDNNGNLKLRSHDIEEFVEVANRYSSDVTALWQVERAFIPQ